jgi:hypothetical protein
MSFIAFDPRHTNIELCFSPGARPPETTTQRRLRILGLIRGRTLAPPTGLAELRHPGTALLGVGPLERRTVSSLMMTMRMAGATTITTRVAPLSTPLVLDTEKGRVVRDAW